MSSESDSDSEPLIDIDSDEESPPRKSTKNGKRTASAKRKSKAADDSSDDEDFEDFEVKTTKSTPKKPRGRPSAKASTPKKPAPRSTATPKKIQPVKKEPELSDYEDDLPLCKLVIPVAQPKLTGKKRVRNDNNGPDRKLQRTQESQDVKAAKRLEEEMPEYKWWLEDDDQTDSKIRWRTLSHNGVYFPPAYIPLPKHVKFIYDGKPMDLEPVAEEAATFYAIHFKSTGIRHTENPIFNKNFFEDFVTILNQGRSKKDKHPVKDFKKCDFSAIADYLYEEREKKKNRTKEERLAEKEEKAKIKEIYGWVNIDGRREMVSNYTVEPPGLFLGRGKHPKIGRIKRRIMPEEVTINISEDAPIPECPIAGHTWKEIVHNPTVSWLAYWRESINDASKYVWLSNNSATKGRADRNKFEVARNLKNHIDDIRDTYQKGFDEGDEQRQLSTAIFLIDKLALRVGNEKSEDEADTVGCCSLRVEHITLQPPDILVFDFLGKDSMRYQNSIKVQKKVFNNIKLFQKNKQPSDELFHLLTTSKLNSYLKQQMPGLTAKVFRTFNASITLQQELAKMDPDECQTVDEKVLFYNRANRQVAILCNHQRTLPKTHDAQMGKLDDKINELKEEIEFLNRCLKAVKAGKPMPKPEVEPDSPRQRIPEDPERLAKKIATVTDRLKKWEIKKIEKEENKSFSTTTSKMNYLDPRITVAWCKKVGVDIGKIFTKTLRQKFPWALDEDEDFEW